MNHEKDIIIKGDLWGSFDFDFSEETALLTSSNGGASIDYYIARYDSLLNYKWAFSFYGGIGTDKDNFVF